MAMKKWRRQAAKTEYALKEGKYFGSGQKCGMGVQRARLRLDYLKPNILQRRLAK
jgi:homoserine acetyltransferase